MREILFRGKPNNALSENKFIYGMLVKQVDLDGKDELCIQTWERDTEGVSSRVLGVISETVGQYTGLTDKNGTKIFEGDIIKNDWCFMKGNSIIRFGEYKSFDMSNDFRQGHLGFYIEALSESEKKLYRKDILYYADKCEVIGNVFDNPELLKGEGKQ